MKKAILALVLVIAVFLSTIYLFNYHRAVLKLFIGASQIVSPAFEMDVLINNHVAKEAKCFKSDNKVFLRLPKGRVYILDLSSKDVGIPNSNHLYYDLLFNKYLVKTDGAVVSVSDSAKGPGINPELKISQDEISFYIPGNKFGAQGDRIRILIK